MRKSFAKCYARHLGGCDGKSAEHYVSKTILESLEPFGIQGFPWLAPGESGSASANSLKAAILCRRHNGELSPYDSEAAKLFAHLKLVDSKQTPEELSTIPDLTINGHFVEKWLLKFLCGAQASGNFLIDGKSFGKVPPSDYQVNLLYDDAPWRPGIGMYFETTDGIQINAHRGVGYDPLYVKTTPTNAQLVGIQVTLWGFPFRGIFAAYSDGSHIPGYRPAKLQIANGSVTRNIVFEWPAGTPVGISPVLRRNGTIPDKPLPTPLAKIP